MKPDEKKNVRELLKKAREIQRGIKKGDLDITISLGQIIPGGYGIPPISPVKDRIIYKEKRMKSESLLSLEKAAEEGDSNALNDLGNLYLKGGEVKKDYKKAFSFYKKAAELGNIHAINNLGMCYYWGDGVEVDMEKAALYHRMAAEGGCVDAMNDLGYMYEHALGVPYVIDQCLYWYKKASENGNTDAMTSLGNLYLHGNGVRKDLQEAFSWFEKAAEKGDVLAKECLAVMYEKGEGVQQDLDKAKAYYQEVFDVYNANAQNDDADSFYRLGCMYFDGVPLIGLKQNYGQAVKWYRKAAKLKMNEAQLCLGNCYTFGLGVAQNYEKAFYWYEQAALKDDVIALSNLCSCYYLGRGVEKDYAMAAACAEMVAAMNYAEAFDTLGDMYRKGEGVEQNYQLAVKWYKKACDANVDTAFAALGDCYLNGWYVSEDKEKAFQLYKKGAELENLAAKVKLAECYIEGIGTPVDIEHARELLEAICGEQEEYRENIVDILEIDKGNSIQYYNPLDEVFLEYYAKAYYLLAHLYYSGNGVKKDQNEAIRLLNLAINLGHTEAAEFRDKIVSETDHTTIQDVLYSYISVEVFRNARGDARLNRMGKYAIMFHHADGSESEVFFSQERSKFMYLLLLMATKNRTGLTPSFFYLKRKDLIKLAHWDYLGVDEDDCQSWIDSFIYRNGRLNLSAYSQAGSGINSSLKNRRNNLTEEEISTYSRNARLGGQSGTYSTLQISPGQIVIPEELMWFVDSGLPSKEELMRTRIPLELRD